MKIKYIIKKFIFNILKGFKSLQSLSFSARQEADGSLVSCWSNESGGIFCSTPYREFDYLESEHKKPRTMAMFFCIIRGRDFKGFIYPVSVSNILQCICQ